MSSQNPYALQGFGSGLFGNAPIETLPLEYYLGLLISEYQNSPKLTAFLKALLQKYDEISQCQVQMDMAFDIDNAVGPQLDMLGAILGTPRLVGFQPSGGVSPLLTDSTYRVYLKAQAAKDEWDGTIDGLQGIWGTLFPGGQIVIDDNQNMTATIFIRGTFTSIEQDLISNGYIVPRPEGVLYTYVFNGPTFGCDLENSFISGVDVGTCA